MADQTMSPLRRRMIEDMSIRKFTPGTQHNYYGELTITCANRHRPKCQGARLRANGSTDIGCASQILQSDPHQCRFQAPLLFECGAPKYGNSVRMSVWAFRPVGGH